MGSPEVRDNERGCKRMQSVGGGFGGSEGYWRELRRLRGMGW